MRIIEKVRSKSLYLFVWFEVMLIPSLLPNVVSAAGLPVVVVEGVTMDDPDILSTTQQIIYAVVDFILIVIGLVALVSVAVLIIKEVKEAKNADDGRWGRVIGAVVGGIMAVVIVLFLLNFAKNMLPGG